MQPDELILKDRDTASIIRDKERIAELEAAALKAAERLEGGDSAMEVAYQLRAALGPNND